MGEGEGIEVERFWEQATQLLASGESALLATVMAVQRQVPRVSPPGAHLIVTAARTVGALDGRAVDRVVVPLLRAAFSSGAFVQQVTIPEDVARGHGMLHGGCVELLVQPLSDFGLTMLQEVTDALGRGESAALTTPLHRHGETEIPGKPALVRQGRTIGEVGDAVLEVTLKALVEAEHPLRWESGERAACIDVVRPLEPLVILGTTLVAEPLCELASRAGFLVTLVDDTGYATPERYPNAAAIVRDNDPVEALLALNLTASTFVVVMSVAHRLDMPVVLRLRRQPLRYLGMMGNPSRVVKCFAALAAEGFTTGELARVSAPIGLNLGAKSPFEIAVAILAQLIQVRRGHSGPVSDWAIPAPLAAG
jgi:xanthine dehydrogenase accessory factor